MDTSWSQSFYHRMQIEAGQCPRGTDPSTDPGNYGLLHFGSTPLSTRLTVTLGLESTKLVQSSKLTAVISTCLRTIMALSGDIPRQTGVYSPTISDRQAQASEVDASLSARGVPAYHRQLSVASLSQRFLVRKSSCRTHECGCKKASH